MSEYDIEQEVSIPEQPMTSAAEVQPKANIFLGMIGAVIGSLAGVLLWIAIDRIGFIAGISGVVMLIASFKGYALLGGRLDRFGTIFCIILSFIMIFVAVNAAVILIFVEEYGIGFLRGTGLLNLLFYIWYVPELRSDILINMAVGYGLYLWAGLSRIKRALADNA